MPNKSCQLGILKTSTLKKVTDVSIASITRVINLSLNMGGFYVNWKTAVMKPLMKSRQLALYNKILTNQQFKLHIKSS